MILKILKIELSEIFKRKDGNPKFPNDAIVVSDSLTPADTYFTFPL